MGNEVGIGIGQLRFAGPVVDPPDGPRTPARCRDSAAGVGSQVDATGSKEMSKHVGGEARPSDKVSVSFRYAPLERGRGKDGTAPATKA